MAGGNVGSYPPIRHRGVLDRVVQLQFLWKRKRKSGIGWKMAPTLSEPTFAAGGIPADPLPRSECLRRGRRGRTHPPGAVPIPNGYFPPRHLQTVGLGRSRAPTTQSEACGLWLFPLLDGKAQRRCRLGDCFLASLQRHIGLQRSPCGPAAAACARAEGVRQPTIAGASWISSSFLRASTMKRA